MNAVLRVTRPHSLRHGNCRILDEPSNWILGVASVREVQTDDGPALKLGGSPNEDDWADPQFADFLLEGILRTKTHRITLYLFRDEYYVRGIRPGNEHKAAIDRRYKNITDTATRWHGRDVCWMEVVVFPLDLSLLAPA